MMHERLRFGLVGCGSVAPYHVHALRKARHTDLVAVADVDPDVAASFARRFGVECAPSVAALLADEGVDAISVATPHDALPVVAAAAARAGKHVIVEKPLAASLDDALELVDICHRAGVRLAPWLERRYQPFAQRAQALVQAGEIGPVLLASINTLVFKTAGYWERGFRHEGPSSTWRQDRQRSGGGVLITNTIHQIDLLAMISGIRVTEVFAHADESAESVETTLAGTLKGASGEIVSLTASSRAFGLSEFPVYASQDVIIGVEGAIVLRAPLEVKHRVTGARTEDVPLVNLADSKALAVDDFASAVLRGDEPPVSAMAAVRALAVVSALYESARTGVRAYVRVLE